MLSQFVSIIQRINYVMVRERQPHKLPTVAYSQHGKS